MSTYQKMILVGNVTARPELQQNGSATLHLIADKTKFRVIVLGDRAKKCAKYLTEGSCVFVEGRVQPSDNDELEILGSTVRFLFDGEPKKHKRRRKYGN